MKYVSVNVAVSRFLVAVEPTIAPATMALYRHYLTRFAADAGRVRLDRMTPARVYEWSRKYHPVSCVRRLFNWATVEARLISVNPVAGIKVRRNGHRRRILDRAELIRLSRSASKQFRYFIVAMVETIARPREIRELNWGDIRTSGSPAWSTAELAAGRCFFWVDTFKGQERRRDRWAVRTLPISPRLGRLLCRLWGNGQISSSRIYVNGLGRPWSCNAVRLQFRRLRRRAGVGVDLRGENVVAYSLRHTGATDAVGAGIKGFTLAELMGHSDIRMTQRYVHLRPDHLIEACHRIAEWKQGRRAKNDRTGSLRPRPDETR